MKLYFFKNAGLKKTAYSFGAMILFVSLIFLFSCKKEDAQYAQDDPEIVAKCSVIFMVGDVWIKDEDGNTRKADLKDEVGVNNEVKTGKNSQVTLQISDVGVIRVLENTTLKIESLQSSHVDKTNLMLSRGSVFSNVSKMVTSSQFEVNTPTATAAVRGTEFMTTHFNESGVSRVVLREGRVALALREDAAAEAEPAIKKSIDVDPGTVVFVEENTIEKEEQSILDELQLSKMSLHEYQDDLDSKDASDLKKIFESVQLKERAIDHRIDQMYETVEITRASPLYSLKQRGRLLTKLYMTDGSQLIGSIVSQDADNIYLNTGDARIDIPKSDIIRRKFIR